MNILRALKKEEAKFLKQLDSARQQLETVRAAMKVLGGKIAGTAKQRSAAARRKMSLAAKARWRKIKAERKS